MKATIEVTEKEAKHIFRKRKIFKIRLPSIQSRTYYITLSIMVLALLLIPILTYNLGEKSGRQYGYSIGYKDGERVTLQSTYKDLTLENALAYHIKYNLVKIFWWVGVVVGIAWIIHGVGFHIVKR